MFQEFEEENFEWLDKFTAKFSTVNNDIRELFFYWIQCELKFKTSRKNKFFHKFPSFLLPIIRLWTDEFHGIIMC